MSVTWGYRAVVMTLDEAPPRSVSPTRRGHALAEHRRGGWQILAVFQVTAKARPSRSRPTFSDGGAASSGCRPTSAAGQMPPGRMDGDRCRRPESTWRRRWSTSVSWRYGPKRGLQP